MTLDNKSEQAMPEGQRITQLRQVFTKALDLALKPCSFEKLSKCFPTLAARQPELLQSAAEQASAYMRETGMGGFAGALKQKELVERVNELEEIIRRARKGEYTAQTHVAYPRAPEVVLSAVSVPAKRLEADRLKKELEDVEVEIERMRADVEKKVEECLRLRRIIQAREEAFHKLVDSVQSMDLSNPA